MRSIIAKQYEGSFSKIDSFPYEQPLFGNELSSLSDCNDDNGCPDRNPKFETMGKTNLFTKRFFDSNLDVDFVFMLPAKPAKGR